MSEPNLDTYRLRQFVAVAEQLNITQAAVQLHLTQQAVSSTIKALERDLKVNLLERSGRTIALTAAGSRLFEGAKPLLDAGSALARATQAAAKGEREEFTIGYTPTIDADTVFNLTAHLLRIHPNVTITLRQLLPDDIHPALRSGTIDVALQQDTHPPHDTESTVITYTPLHVALATSHPLATRTHIALNELKNDTLILDNTPQPTQYAEYLKSICRRAGFEPRTTHNRVRGTSPTNTVADTGGFALVTTSPGTYHHGRTTVITLDSHPLSPLHAIWLRHTTSRLRNAFLTHTSNQNPDTTTMTPGTVHSTAPTRYCSTQDLRPDPLSDGAGPTVLLPSSRNR